MWMKVCPLLTRNSTVVRQRFYSFKMIILKSVDNKQCAFLLLLDLSELFYTVDQEVLHRLRFNLGMKGKALAWLQTYLTDSQSVQIDGSTSSIYPLRFGVPQGSVLGPLLYLLYVSPLADPIRRHDMTFDLYADNTELYTNFCCDDGVELTTAISGIESCILLIALTGWLQTNWN